LESSEFNSLTLAEEVRERERALIKLINGVAKFNRDNFLGISEDAITRLENDGKRHNYLFLEGTATIRTKVSVQLTAIAADGSEKVATQPSALESLLEVAKKYNVVADSLIFYRDDTWISLYKAYEIIRDDVGDSNRLSRMVGRSILTLIGSRRQLRAELLSEILLGTRVRNISHRHSPAPVSAVSRDRVALYFARNFRIRKPSPSQDSKFHY